MGCDIHVYREAKKDGVWESIDVWANDPDDDGYDDDDLRVSWESQHVDHNYALFGMLTGGEVRYECDFGWEPRDLPDDCDPRIRNSYTDDDHNASWLTTRELHELRVMCAREFITEEQIPLSAELQEKLPELIANGSPIWDLLSPPTEYHRTHYTYRGTLESLSELIGRFEGPPSDDQRLVFWFDN